MWHYYEGDRYEKDKKKYIILLLFAFISIISWQLIKEAIYIDVDINYITSIERNNINIPEIWFIITSESQRTNWVNKGLDLPEVNFDSNFMIISRFKIENLKYTNYGNNEVCGPPSGSANYNILGSKKGYYYIYLMEKVWLMQGVG